MSLAEIKERIARLNREERLEIAALIARLNRAEDPEYQEELERRMSEMDNGRKTSSTSLTQLHDKLSSEGR